MAVVAGVGAEAREGDGELGLPTAAGEVFEVSGEGAGFGAPVGEAEEGADPDAPEAAGVGALGAVEAPSEVFLGSGGVELGVGFAVVGFLIDDEAFRAAGDEFGVLVVLHRAHLDGEGGDEGGEAAQAFLEVSVGDELRVLAGDEEEIAEAESVQVAGLGGDLGGGEGGAQDRVVARETAVAAIVDALVGEIERREEAHGAAEMTAGEGGAAPGEPFEAGGRLRGEECLEALQERRSGRGGLRELGGKAHDGEVGRRGGIVKGEMGRRSVVGGQ